jgi:hypothetical protein
MITLPEMDEKSASDITTNFEDVKFILTETENR